MHRCVVLGWDGTENGTSGEIVQTGRSLTAGWSEARTRVSGKIALARASRCASSSALSSATTPLQPGAWSWSWTDHRGGGPLTRSPRSPNCHPHRRRRHSRRRCDVQPGRPLAAGHDLRRAFRHAQPQRAAMNRAQSRPPRSTGGRESLICTRQFRAASRWQAGAGCGIRIREDASAPWRFSRPVPQLG